MNGIIKLADTLTVTLLVGVNDIIIVLFDTSPLPSSRLFSCSDCLVTFVVFPVSVGRLEGKARSTRGDQRGRQTC